MKRFLVTLATAGLLVGMAAGPVAAAPGGVARNQVTTLNYSMPIGYGHTYTVVINPCDGGSITATGMQGVHNPDETITATLSADRLWITFNAVYVGGWGGSPYSWSGTFPIGGGPFTISATDGVYPGVVMTLVSTSPTSYANHGAYVSAMGGGSDAAHSCIGMPIVAQQ
jgi:hypothetical protein